ncbi:RNase H, partial [Trametes versicolor FP-101664 SS1]|uniref:RNase H n=1 Tax=Trametes versicolor (strain FP-101664) TaxID=717944 RepID=UPI0004623455
MVKIAKKYGIKCETSNPTADLRESLPIWNHVGRNDERRVENSIGCKCLRNNHQVRTVGQCRAVAGRLSDDESGHVARHTCGCADCDLDRNLHLCDNPHRCATAAARLLGRINAKWNPSRPANEDGLTLTQTRKDENNAARIDHKRILFDPSISTGLPTAESLRAFVPACDRDERPALRLPRPYQVSAEDTEVYTDGSAHGNGSESARAGSGIWFGEGDPRNEGARVPFDTQTDQVAEFYAVIMAHRKVPPFAPLHVVSD